MIVLIHIPTNKRNFCDAIRAIGKHAGKSLHSQNTTKQQCKKQGKQLKKQTKQKKNIRKHKTNYQETTIRTFTAKNKEKQ